jgi:hypothetical protein
MVAQLSQEISCLLWKQEIHYCRHKRLSVQLCQYLTVNVAIPASRSLNSGFRFRPGTIGNDILVGHDRFPLHFNLFLLIIVPLVTMYSELLAAPLN